MVRDWDEATREGSTRREREARRALARRAIEGVVPALIRLIRFYLYPGLAVSSEIDECMHEDLFFSLKHQKALVY